MIKSLTISGAALYDCAEHLNRTGAAGTIVENRLVQYMLIVIHADYEEYIRAIVVERVAGLNDKQLGKFLNDSARYLVRSIKLDALKGVLKAFSKECRRDFIRRVDEFDMNRQQPDKLAAQWNAIVDNRHGIAHRNSGKTTVDMTWTELVEAYEATQRLLSMFEEAINVRD